MVVGEIFEPGAQKIVDAINGYHLITEEPAGNDAT